MELKAYKSLDPLNKESNITHPIHSIITQYSTAFHSKRTRPEQNRPAYMKISLVSKGYQKYIILKIEEICMENNEQKEPCLTNKNCNVGPTFSSKHNLTIVLLDSPVHSRRYVLKHEQKKFSADKALKGTFSLLFMVENVK